MERHDQTFSIIVRRADDRILDKGYSLKMPVPAGFTQYDIPGTNDAAILAKRVLLDAAELTRSDGKSITQQLPADQIYDSAAQTITTDPTGNDDPEKYKGDRGKDYPDPFDQLEKLWEFVDASVSMGVVTGDVAAMLAEIKAVKVKYPKT
ncbi:MAG: hypothetical protein IEMM0002_0801 [bacterium]|nr:MAG: hypothetical protein IEMM0002_0801 [bacterium]